MLIQCFAKIFFCIFQLFLRRCAKNRKDQLLVDSFVDFENAENAYLVANTRLDTAEKEPRRE